MMKGHFTGLFGLMVPLVCLHCSSTSNKVSVLADSGIADAAAADAGMTDAGISTSTNSGAGALRGFAPPADPGPGGLILTASGEVFALQGFVFPPATQNDAFMVDGWQFKLNRFLVVFDKVTLWSNPDMVPTDQSQHGPAVAEIDGPWAVDLHTGGPIAGKGGGGEQALAFATLTKQSNGDAFDTTVTYGFGFSTVPAVAHAINVNLNTAALADYQYMVQNGYSVLYSGTATFVGTNCVQNGNTGTVAYAFDQIPHTVPFRLGFSTPTSYVNCQNGSDLAGPGVNGEEHPRGVQFRSDGSITAQVTIHMDHPFWESFAENSPLHFDQIAAQYVGMANPEAHIEDLRGVNFTAFSDRNRVALPWRSCVSNLFYTPPGMGQMYFNSLTVPVNPAATDPKTALRDYYDYIRFSQSTQGHLNSQGLCFISRNFPAPPGGS